MALCNKLRAHYERSRAAGDKTIAPVAQHVLSKLDAYRGLVQSDEEKLGGGLDPVFGNAIIREGDVLCQLVHWPVQ